jgi:Ser/Thr protein kinase RdoA (MazF antagonist)
MTSQAIDATVAAALRQYALRGPVIVGHNEAGFMNDNWLVHDNVTNEPYMLRKYRHHAPSRIEFQLSFQEHLHASGFPTARVISTNDGTLFVTFDSSYWSLSHFIDGHIYDFSSQVQAREAGRRLAQFQAAGERFASRFVEPPSRDVAYIGSPLPYYPWRATVLTEQHEQQLRELYHSPQYAHDLSSFKAWRREAALVWTPDRLAALPESYLHCDYHGRNMVFRDDTMVGLFDFDFVARGPRVYDVARGIYNFGRDYRGSTTLREEFCSAFLNGYESQAPLTEEERRSLPFMAALNWAPDAAVDGRPPEEASKNDETTSRLQSAIRLMRAVESEMDRLTPQLGWGDAH